MYIKNTFIFVLIVIAIIHFTMTNVFEKVLFQLWKGSDRRPITICLNDDTIACLGMPSGHAEISVFVSLLLYLNNIISLPFALTIIVVICLQRILFKRHTILQVILGCIIGLLYTFIYKSLHNPIYMLWAAITFPIVMLLCIFYIVDTHVNKQIPDWVDPELHPLIYKKQSIPIYDKLISLLAICIFHNRSSFCSWNQLEGHLNALIDVIKDKHFDAIIGIKTGGAIISNYVSKRLNLPCYYIKVSAEEFKCAKSHKDRYRDLYVKYVQNNKHKYIVCEPIIHDLSNKNVLVLDEIIDTGTTIDAVIEYLYNTKQVANVYIGTITTLRPQSNYQFNLTSTTNNRYLIWPWGFDN